jgi:5-(carboxyamino)imidazole ribonucleotide mutase
VPVATVGIGGGRNAGLLAVRILAASDSDDGRALRTAVERFQADLADSVVARDAALQETLASDD